MQFLKRFLFNLGALLVIGIVLYIAFPKMMGDVFQLYGALFGPVFLLIVAAAALPRRRRRY
jgi:hypothetical protein